MRLLAVFCHPSSIHAMVTRVWRHAAFAKYDVDQGGFMDTPDLHQLLAGVHICAGYTEAHTVAALERVHPNGADDVLDVGEVIVLYRQALKQFGPAQSKTPCWIPDDAVKVRAVSFSCYVGCVCKSKKKTGVALPRRVWRRIVHRANASFQGGR